ncbi:RNA polymerase II-associated protein 1 [Anticarsia gemmatalis]|uniref:RNA polymerase II-associated protein 1 n=1 Tax=Anticarsia gemmatalis TaxID=129554 RepID=UPI003F777BF9
MSIKRPSSNDDLLQLQEEFFRDRETQNIQPAAAVTNLHPEINKRPSTEPGNRKPSKYARSKGLKGSDAQASTSSVMGDILEKNIEDSQQRKPEPDDDKVYFPVVLPSVLGNIVEKNVSDFVDFEPKAMPSQGFPEVTKFEPSTSRKSVRQDVNVNESIKMDVDINVNLPSKSFIVSSKEASEIHKENVKLLSEMSERDILEEQKKLLSNLDPQIVEFIKSRRQANKQDIVKKEVRFEPQETEIKTTEDSMDTDPIPDNDSLWDNDILSHPEVNKWLHFDSLEKDKLEWIKGIEESKKIKADEPYEARFDFNGYLLPYTIEYTEKTKTLFHHGDEPHRPGYSITELIELTRSTVTQQRVLALNTIAGILEYHSAGTYKNIIDIPLSKLFFIVRIAIDENKVIVLEPALKAMRNLLYNRIDEASLDALIGFEEGTLQPCLENDKSEIEELESKESEFNDYHLAEIDIITALLRTDILQRLYYILDAVRPSFNCVQYCLQILTRLARDSFETSQKMVEMENLMTTIIKNFLPVTPVNFVFDASIVYKRKPILAALKLFRILSLQTGDITHVLLHKYEILKPVSEYISSKVDRAYGLKIQIEAYCILSNFLHFGLGIETAISLSPVIMTTFYNHVESTSIFTNSSILSATHAAVVLQLLSRLLHCNLQGFHSHKTQMYPLVKDGVQKWVRQLCHADDYTCGHLRLLCSALDLCKTVIMIECLPMKVLNESLMLLFQSQGFERLVKNLIPSSNLLSGLDSSDLHLIKNLMSLGGAAIDTSQKVLPVLNILSPVPFLASLSSLLTYMNEKEISESFLRHMLFYLSELSKRVPSLCDNWFTRMETNLVINIIKLSTRFNVSEGSKDLLYSVANKLCYILRTDKKHDLYFLFNNVVFNKHWFTAERLLNLVNVSDPDSFSKALTSIENIKMCYRKVVNMNYRETGPNILLKSWREPILPRDWIYMPILTLYSWHQEAGNYPKMVGRHAKKIAERAAAEREFIIISSLEWILFNEICFPELLKDIDVTDRFCRIMCVFLCDNSLFLDARIKVLLQKCTEALFKRKSKFNFDKPLVGLHNFQDFYTQFLEQFQAVSYGDHTFAACVLVPLAQKHNVKWRKLLWSEYAGCLRALDCPENMLCYDMNDYLYPEETDESVIKSYLRALSSNLLRPDTIVHKIASHHVECYKKRIST